MLAAGPDRDPVAVDLGHDAVRLHGVLVDAGEDVVVLDDDVRGCERGVQVTAVDRVAVADVAVTFGQRPQAVEVTRSQGLVVDERRAGRQRFLDRAHDRQLVVFHDDRAGGGLGRGLVSRGHGGNRLTCETDPVDGDDRAILDGVAVIRVDVQDVCPRQDRDDARHGIGGRGVDRDDPGMREWTPQYLSVEHPGDHQIAHVPRVATQLLRGIGTGHRSAHLGCAARSSDAWGDRRHQASRSEASSPTASRIAR